MNNTKRVNLHSAQNSIDTKSTAGSYFMQKPLSLPMSTFDIQANQFSQPDLQEVKQTVDSRILFRDGSETVDAANSSAQSFIQAYILQQRKTSEANIDLQSSELVQPPSL